MFSVSQCFLFSTEIYTCKTKGGPEPPLLWPIRTSTSSALPHGFCWWCQVDTKRTRRGWISLRQEAIKSGRLFHATFSCSENWLWKQATGAGRSPKSPSLLSGSSLNVPQTVLVPQSSTEHFPWNILPSEIDQTFKSSWKKSKTWILSDFKDWLLTAGTRMDYKRIGGRNRHWLTTYWEESFFKITNDDESFPSSINQLSPRIWNPILIHIGLKLIAKFLPR